MSKLVLRGFAQRKVRALLTGVAIVLGVALMAGTYILTDTINHAFAEVFGDAYKNKSVVVTAKETLGRGSGSEAVRRSTKRRWPACGRCRAWPRPSGGISTQGDAARRRAASGSRATARPSIVDAGAASALRGFHRGEGTPAARAPMRWRSTRRPPSAIISGSAQQIVIAGSAPARRYTISGIAKFAGSESFGGTSVALLMPAQAQYVAGEPGEYDSINVAARPGVSPAELRAARAGRAAGDAVVRTGAQEAANQTSELEEKLGFLRTFLLVFAYVALVVGAFIIFNTFSITVAQRMREFGLLRTLGASRMQIMRSVVEEGLLLGSRDRWSGCSAGIGLAPALDGLFKAFGADLPDNGTVLEPRTVIVSLGGRASSSRCSPASSRRCAPRACRRSRRCARAFRSRRARCPPGAAADRAFAIAAGRGRSPSSSARRRQGDRARAPARLRSCAAR